MIVEEALIRVIEVLKQKRLNDVQELVFCKSWEGSSYKEIAELAGYDPEYIKLVGFQLWNLLSKALGEKVTKSNIHSVLAHSSLSYQKLDNSDARKASYLYPIDNDSVTNNCCQDWGEAMVQFNPEIRLPTGAELPNSDDKPVDHENQNFLPNLLLFLLKFHWNKRHDWFFGVDMAIYHTTGISPLVPIVPDGFLSLGVERFKGETLRLSYVVWEENNIPPIFALEIVSQTYGGEYEKKMDIYAKLGVIYYVIYNPYYWRQDQHQPFEVYRLVNGEYEQQIGEPFWMPEVGLGIGRGRYNDGESHLEVLYWFDRQGNRYLTAEELVTRYRERFGELPE